MSSRGKNVVYRCMRGATRRKITSVHCGDAKRQKSTYIKDGITAVESLTPERTNDVADLSNNLQTQPPLVLEEPHNSTYAEKRTAVTDEWQEIHEALQKGFVESHVPGSNCVLCGEDLSVDVRIICDDCGPGTVYCQACCGQIHAIVRFHMPQIWQVGILFIIITPKYTLIGKGKGCWIIIVFKC